MTISYIKIPIQFYSDKKLCEIKRAILGLVIAFGNNGLKIPDESLAAIFGKTRQWVNKLISELQADGYVRLEKPGSKYRVIYCQEKLTVKDNLLSSKVDSKTALLSSFVPSTVNTDLTHNNKKNKKRTKKSETFVIPTLAEIEKYVSEKNLSINPKKFLEYFTESGWIDSKGNKVRNWKQKLLTWDNHNKPNPSGKSKNEYSAYVAENLQITHEATAEEAEQLRIKMLAEGN